MKRLFHFSQANADRILQAINLFVRNNAFFNPIQDGGSAKTGSSTSFSPVISTNVRISLENFWPFCQTGVNFQGYI